MAEDTNQSSYISTSSDGTENSTNSSKLWLVIGSVIAIIVIAVIIFLLIGKKTSSEVTDFGTNFDGFITKAVKTCEPSQVIYTFHSDIPGLRSDTTYLMKLNGAQNGSCSFYMELTNYTSNEPGAEAPPLELFIGLNKTCNIPIDMVEQEFEY